MLAVCVIGLSREFPKNAYVWESVCHVSRSMRHTMRIRPFVEQSGPPSTGGGDRGRPLGNRRYAAFAAA